MYATHTYFQKRSSRNLLKVANNVFIADAFDLNKTFKNVALRQFGSEITSMKFYRSDAVDTINQWVSTKTNNKIERLLTQGTIFLLFIIKVTTGRFYCLRLLRPLCVKR